MSAITIATPERCRRLTVVACATLLAMATPPACSREASKLLRCHCTACPGRPNTLRRHVSSRFRIDSASNCMRRRHTPPSPEACRYWGQQAASWPLSFVTQRSRAARACHCGNPPLRRRIVRFCSISLGDCSAVLTGACNVTDAVAADTRCQVPQSPSALNPTSLALT